MRLATAWGRSIRLWDRGVTAGSAGGGSRVRAWGGLDPVWGRGDDCGVVGRGEPVAALVGPVLVDVVRIVAEDLLGVTAVEEKDLVGALLAYGAHEAFGVRVAVRTARGDLGHGDACSVPISGSWC